MGRKPSDHSSLETPSPPPQSPTSFSVDLLLCPKRSDLGLSSLSSHHPPGGGGKVSTPLDRKGPPRSGPERVVGLHLPPSTLSGTHPRFLTLTSGRSWGEGFQYCKKRP